jgi:hypothetical protein
MHMMKMAFLLLALGLQSNGPVAQKPDSLRVLFLGASYFLSGGSALQSFEGFCEAANLQCEAVSQRPAPPYTHGVTFMGLRTPIRGPNEAAESPEVQELIRDGDFDFVVVWAFMAGLPHECAACASDVPAGYEEFFGFRSRSYEENLADLTSLHRTIVSSGAETVLYMFHPWLPFMHLMHPVAQLYGRLQIDLSSVEIDGRQHQVHLVPAGLLWLDAVALPGEYKLENAFDHQSPRFDRADWYRDGGHPAALGQYANGALFFAYLTGRDPRDIPYTQLPRDFFNDPPEQPARVIPGEDAEWIKRRVWYYYSTSRQGPTPS